MANGKIRNYQITKIIETTGKFVDIFVGNTSEGNLVLAASHDYIIEVRGITDAGLSPHFSTVRIPSKEESKIFLLCFVLKDGFRACLASYMKG